MEKQKKQHPVLIFYQLCTMVIGLGFSIAYIDYYIVYKDEYGERGGSGCDDMFPVWMLVTGVMCLFIFLILAAMSVGSVLILVGGTDAGGNMSPLASLGALIIVGMMPCICLMIPTTCFSIGWAIYGLVLLSNTNWTCHEEMYDLVITQIITMASLNIFGQCLLVCFPPKDDDKDTGGEATKTAQNDPAFGGVV